MGDGWLKLYWKVKQSIVYSNGSTFALWGHILLSVARKRKILGNGQVLEAGQCIISASNVAKWLGKHKTTVSQYLRLFEQEGMITIEKRDRNGTTISVCNWGTYQDIPEGHATNSDRNGTATELQRNCNSTQTEIPKKEKIPKKGGADAQRAPSKRFVAPTVDEVARYCAERNNSIDASCFVDYYEARGWILTNGRKTRDWKACVRTWEKKERKGFSNGKNNGTIGPGQRFDPNSATDGNLRIGF